VLSDYFDHADDVIVEASKIFRGNPPFGVVTVSNLLDLVTSCEARRDSEAHNVSNAVVSDVPLPGDFFGVPLVGDRVEVRLTREPRGPSAKAGLLEELELHGTDWPIHGHEVHRPFHQDA
jgi:hypothetical protein